MFVVVKNLTEKEICYVKVSLSERKKKCQKERQFKKCPECGFQKKCHMSWGFTPTQNFRKKVVFVKRVDFLKSILSGLKVVEETENKIVLDR